MTSSPSFVHLRTHTEYSVVDGMLRVDDMVAAAAADEQPALAITDLSNLFGAIKFYGAARGKGVQPLIGADLWLEAEGDEKQPSRLLLLVQNRTGYLNLCELISHAWTENLQRHQACVAWPQLAKHGDGLIALSGATWARSGWRCWPVMRRGPRRRRCGWLRCSLGASISNCSVPGKPATRPR
ncbi:DNA polymerase III subunit alpha [Methylibium sp. T29-B]|nr:DNA polymerase III subunit alpha [Methylibium sp. T29-B]